MVMRFDELLGEIEKDKVAAATFFPSNGGLALNVPRISRFMALIAPLYEYNKAKA